MLKNWADWFKRSNLIHQPLRLMVALFVFLYLLGCTKGIPEFGQIDSDSASLAELKLHGTSIETPDYLEVLIFNPNDSVSFSGTCDAGISELQWSFNDGGDWANVGTSMGTLS